MTLWTDKSLVITGCRLALNNLFDEYIFISGVGAHHRARFYQNNLQSQKPTKTHQNITRVNKCRVMSNNKKTVGARENAVTKSRLGFSFAPDWLLMGWRNFFES